MSLDKTYGDLQDLFSRSLDLQQQMLQSLLRIESRLNQQFRTRTEGQSSIERTSVAATQPVVDITTANISSEETRYDFILSSAKRQPQADSIQEPAKNDDNVNLSSVNATLSISQNSDSSTDPPPTNHYLPSPPNTIQTTPAVASVSQQINNVGATDTGISPSTTRSKRAPFTSRQVKTQSKRDPNRGATQAINNNSSQSDNSPVQQKALVDKTRDIPKSLQDWLVQKSKYGCCKIACTGSLLIDRIQGQTNQSNR